MNVILKPIVSEKMNKIGEKTRNVGFIVDKRANKIQIKKSVEELYGVKVDEVNTMNYAGKVKTRNTKKGFVIGTTTAFKKAIVLLAEGETIDFYSNI